MEIDITMSNSIPGLEGWNTYLKLVAIGEGSFLMNFVSIVPKHQYLPQHPLHATAIHLNLSYKIQ